MFIYCDLWGKVDFHIINTHWYSRLYSNQTCQNLGSIFSSRSISITDSCQKRSLGMSGKVCRWMSWNQNSHGTFKFRPVSVFFPKFESASVTLGYWKFFCVCVCFATVNWVEFNSEVHCALWEEKMGMFKLFIPPYSYSDICQ